MKEKIKTVAIVVLIFLLLIACNNNSYLNENIELEKKVKELEQQITVLESNAVEQQAETTKQQEQTTETKEEAKDNLSHIKGKDLVKTISDKIGKEYQTKTESNTNRYEIYDTPHYDVTILENMTAENIREMMLITYEGDLNFLKYSEELFVDKTEVDKWLEENWQKEEAKTTIDGYSFLIGTANGTTKLFVEL